MKRQATAGQTLYLLCGHCISSRKPKTIYAICPTCNKSFNKGEGALVRSPEQGRKGDLSLKLPTTKFLIPIQNS